VDFQAPVEERLDAAASEPAAECGPAPAAAVTSLSSAQAAITAPAPPRRQRSYLPPRLRRVVRRAAEPRVYLATAADNKVNERLTGNNNHSISPLALGRVHDREDFLAS